MTASSPPLLTTDRVRFKKRIESQKRAFDILTDLLVKGQREVSKHEVFDALIKRDKLGKTCIGNGISIPRAVLNIPNMRAAILVLKKGLKTDSVDKKPITYFLAILIPAKSDMDYSIILATLNNNLAIGDDLSKVASSQNPDHIVEYFESLISVKGNH